MTDDNVIEIPTKTNENIKNFLFAPLSASWHKICIEGKIIPKMYGRMYEGKCEVFLDDRWVYIFDTIEAAYSAASMAANAMAIGEGYPWFGADSKTMPFAATVMMMDNEP